MMKSKKHLNKEVKICAVYGRVSVDDEVEHGSKEQQKHMGLDVAKSLTESQGVDHVVKYVLVEEKGVSGGTTNRPKYQELLNLISRRKINAVISKEVSRLNRSTKDFCEFMDLCQNNNVSVHIKNLDVDPNLPMGKAMFQLLAVVAELEREMIRERTKSSIRSAMINNSKINGGSIVLGFDRVNGRAGVWTPNTDELQIVEFLMKTFLDTESYVETFKIANKNGMKSKTKGKFNKDNLKRILTNEKYIGKMTVPESDIVVDLPFGEVISRALFNDVQKLISKLDKENAERSSRLKNRSGKRKYILAGLLVHEDGTLFKGDCGTGRNGTRYSYYKNKKNNLSFDALEIEAVVLKSLEVFNNDERMLQCVQAVKKDKFSKLDLIKSNISQVKKSIVDMNDKENLALQGIEKAGALDSERVIKLLDKKLECIEAERKELENSLICLEKDYEQMSESAADANTLKRSLEAVFRRLREVEPAVQKNILKQIFKKIVVHENNKLELHWSIPTANSDREEQSFGFEEKWGGKLSQYRNFFIKYPHYNNCKIKELQEGLKTENK